MQTNHRTKHSEYSACDSLVTQMSKAQITLVLVCGSGHWVGYQNNVDWMENVMVSLQNKNEHFLFKLPHTMKQLSRLIVLCHCCLSSDECSHF